MITLLITMNVALQLVRNTIYHQFMLLKITKHSYLSAVNGSLFFLEQPFFHIWK